MAILHTKFSNVFSWMKTLHIFFQTSQKFIPGGPSDNKSSVIQVMAWHHIGPYLNKRWSSSPTYINPIYLAVSGGITKARGLNSGLWPSWFRQIFWVMIYMHHLTSSVSMCEYVQISGPYFIITIYARRWPKNHQIRHSDDGTKLNMFSSHSLHDFKFIWNYLAFIFIWHL